MVLFPYASQRAFKIYRWDDMAEIYVTYPTMNRYESNEMCTH